MNLAQIKNDGRVMLEASAQCQTPTLAGFMRGRADEMLGVVAAWSCAMTMELEEETLDIVSASTLEPGVWLVWPDYGRGKVRRMSRDGLGIMVAWEYAASEDGFELPLWINVLGPTSPVVVCLPPPPKQSPPQMGPDPEDVLNDSAFDSMRR